MASHEELATLGYSRERIGHFFECHWYVTVFKEHSLLSTTVNVSGLQRTES